MIVYAIFYFFDAVYNIEVTSKIKKAATFSGSFSEYMMNFCKSWIKDRQTRLLYLP
ncbi:hypothetical protein FHW89_004160 [Mucilaginibacter sp. SG564]|nr:hypothetical protein [Mucilaginibacter sp. SG564]